MFFKQTRYNTFRNVFTKKPEEDDVYLEDDPDSLANDGEGAGDREDDGEADEENDEEEDEEDEPSLDEILEQEEFEDDEAWEMYKELHRR